MLRRIPAVLWVALYSATAGAQILPAQTYEPKVGQAGKDVVWVPTPEMLVEKMLDMGNVTAEDVVIDLGSGDGRTVIAAAKRGATAIGVEFDPEMVALSQSNLKQAGVARNATIVRADIFQFDFSKATVLTMFLLPSINMKLRSTILNMRPGTRVVTNSFTMEDWEPDRSETIKEDCTGWCTAHLWIVPAKIAGTWQLPPTGVLSLTQQFQKFSGTLGTTPITSGELRGSEIAFAADGTKYTGTVNTDVIEGRTSTGQSWTATRKQ